MVLSAHRPALRLRTYRDVTRYSDPGRSRNKLRQCCRDAGFLPCSQATRYVRSMSLRNTLLNHPPARLVQHVCQKAISCSSEKCTVVAALGLEITLGYERVDVP